MNKCFEWFIKNNNDLRNRKGMSLGEVLIALALVGLLAVILFPTLKGAKPNENEVLHNKATHIVETIVNDISTDPTLYPEETGIVGLSNVVGVRFNGQTFSGDTKFCGLFANHLNFKPGSKVNCKAGEKTISSIEGMDWYLPITDFSDKNEKYIIRVDVNGSGKGPNCEEGNNACKNPDIFEYLVRADGKVFKHKGASKYCIHAIITPEGAGKITLDNGKGEFTQSGVLCGFKAGEYGYTVTPNEDNITLSSSSGKLTILNQDERISAEFGPKNFSLIVRKISVSPADGNVVIGEVENSVPQWKSSVSFPSTNCSSYRGTTTCETSLNLDSNKIYALRPDYDSSGVIANPPYIATYNLKNNGGKYEVVFDVKPPDKYQLSYRIIYADPECPQTGILGTGLIDEGASYDIYYIYPTTCIPTWGEDSSIINRYGKTTSGVDYGVMGVMPSHNLTLDLSLTKVLSKYKVTANIVFDDESTDKCDKVAVTVNGTTKSSSSCSVVFNNFEKNTAVSISSLVNDEDYQIRGTSTENITLTGDYTTTIHVAKSPEYTATITKSSGTGDGVVTVTGPDGKKAVLNINQLGSTKIEGLHLGDEVIFTAEADSDSTVSSSVISPEKVTISGNVERSYKFNKVAAYSLTVKYECGDTDFTTCADRVEIRNISGDNDHVYYTDINNSSPHTNVITYNNIASGKYQILVTPNNYWHYNTVQASAGGSITVRLTPTVVTGTVTFTQYRNDSAITPVGDRATYWTVEASSDVSSCATWRTMGKGTNFNYNINYATNTQTFGTCIDRFLKPYALANGCTEEEYENGWCEEEPDNVDEIMLQCTYEAMGNGPTMYLDGSSRYSVPYGFVVIKNRTKANFGQSGDSIYQSNAVYPTGSGSFAANYYPSDYDYPNDFYWSKLILYPRDGQTSEQGCMLRYIDVVQPLRAVLACSEGWTEYNGKCYQYFGTTSSYNPDFPGTSDDERQKAINRCIDNGGTLLLDNEYSNLENILNAINDQGYYTTTMENNPHYWWTRSDCSSAYTPGWGCHLYDSKNKHILIGEYSTGKIGKIMCVTNRIWSDND